ncbi:unnamed protein product [Porites evermanni]|uniref:Mitochondrial calcium uniporter regulator 1 n=1 Tax=Porites evermanni TaxID=104178 RepID=A0ABN8N948_9CNID|nr:unnamed protein product [Porites evermanni]
MFKTSHVLLNSCLNLFRQSCRFGPVFTNDLQPVNITCLRRLWKTAGFHHTKLFSRLPSLSSSLDISDRKQQNGECFIKDWKRSKSNSSYITPGGIIFHFDTHKLVKRLQDNGFSEVQAESLTASLVDIITSSVHSVANSTVSKIDQVALSAGVKFCHVNVSRNEMFLLEQGKFSRIQEENQKLRDEVASLKGILQVTKLEFFLFAQQHATTSNNMQQGVQTDATCNIQQSCWPTMLCPFARGFRLCKVSSVSQESVLTENLAVRDQRIKDTENRIETEVAKLGTQLEAQKLDLIKYIVGSLLSCVTLFLAVWRFVKT